MSLVGQRVELDIGPIAHGGHCVARLDGRVVFVRHAIPGERVIAAITEGDEEASFLRADAVEILQAAPGRTAPRCPVSGPGGCGGCDFQHVDLVTQRAMLGNVVSEQLSRLAGIEREVVVEAPDDGDGLGWRTRVTFRADSDNRLGLRRHRSHDVIRVDPCPIADPRLSELTAHRWPADQVEGVVSSHDEVLAIVHETRGRLPKLGLDGLVDASGERLRGRTHVREQVRGRDFRVTGSGFWQVHPQAASILVEAVLAYVRPEPGERIADLYSGVGLFSAFLAEQVGADGRVLSVESGKVAVRDAKRNLHDLPNVSIVGTSVEDAFGRGTIGSSCDAVVLDPPRTGARSAVVRQIAELAPSRVVYVACDPAALARDVATFAAHGYELAELRAFDLFPMTHHVECVALLRPAS